MTVIFNPNRLDRQTLRLGVALLIVYLVWGTTYFALDVAMQTLPPVLMNGARFLLAGVLMLAIAGRARPGRRPRSGARAP
jgi:drug/metabolite transporter (DMT)-like permease